MQEVVDVVQDVLTAGGETTAATLGTAVIRYEPTRTSPRASPRRVRGGFSSTSSSSFLVVVVVVVVVRGGDAVGAGRPGGIGLHAGGPPRDDSALSRRASCCGWR